MSALPDWVVAVRALGGGYSALARKLGGRQSVVPLSLSELEELRSALRPFVHLADEVEGWIADEVTALERMGALLADASPFEGPDPAAPEPPTGP